MNVLSLCAGIGGLDLAIKHAIPDARTVCYIEIDPFCQGILLRRMDDGWLDRAPIWPDLRTFDGGFWRGVVDCVASGFPCQPFSHAGKRKGDADARNLWPDVRRVISESEPAVVILENVLGALPYFYHVVLPELSGLGYAASAGLFTAAEVGAPHRRQRVFVLAVVNSRYGSGGPEQGSERQAMGTGTFPAWRGKEYMADAFLTSRKAATSEPDKAGRIVVAGPSGDGHVGDPDPARRQGRCEPERKGSNELPPWPPSPTERDRWADILARWPEFAPALGYPPFTRDGLPVAPESPLRRVADEGAHRMDRLRALGNAVVPAQGALAIRTLWRLRCGD